MNPVLALLGAAPVDGGSPFAGTLFMFAAIGGIFYFLIIRPQRQQQKRHEAMVRNLSRGDEVATVGGVIGKIVHLSEDRVVIKSGDTRLEVERGKISRVLGSSQDKGQARAGSS